MSGGDHTVFLTPAVRRDLQSIHAFITAQRDEDDADRLIDTLMARVGALQQFPMRGSVPKELEAVGAMEYRQVVAGVYRIIYRILDQRIAIVMIADGRRDMQTLLRERLLA